MQVLSQLDGHGIATFGGKPQSRACTAAVLRIPDRNEISRQQDYPKNREMREEPTILLKTKERFSEPTMFVKTQKLSGLCHDVVDSDILATGRTIPQGTLFGRRTQPFCSRHRMVASPFNALRADGVFARTVDG